MKKLKSILGIFFALSFFVAANIAEVDRTEKLEASSFAKFELADGDVTITCEVKPDIICAEGESAGGTTWKVYGDRAEVIIEEE